MKNCPSSFAKTSNFETGISDFHKIFVTVLKFHYKKQKSNIIQDRNYKNFVNKAIKTEPNNKIVEMIYNTPNAMNLIKFLHQRLQNMLI